MILRTTSFAALIVGAGTVAQSATPTDVLATYADIAQAGYEDSLTTAVALKAALQTLVAAPTEANLDAAKAAWRAARIPYQQTEAYRFGNPVVDAWEGKVNAWPLDEGLIDYVAGDAGLNEENPFAGANIIANPKLEISGKVIDTTEITPEALAGVHEFDGIDANVTTGYHAIEFLLWGQDLNGTGPGAGARPASDFDPQNCTGGNCERRAAYLLAAADLLVSDLEEAVGLWSAGGQGRLDVLADPKQGLIMAFTGMGSLSYGEQAGERMQLGLLLHDPEEEHDCFSDNTHISHFYDGKGVQNVYLGQYTRIDGSTVSGPSLYDIVREKDAPLADALKGDIAATMDALGAIVAKAEGGTAYDQLIGAGNADGNAVIQSAIDALIAQTRNIERAVAAVGLDPIELEGSDSLDNPNAVFE